MNKKEIRLNNPKLYYVWGTIIQRCTNKNNQEYVNYGYRNINICDDWKNNFISFYEWAISNGYKNGLSIDRINNNKGYSPENCRWATGQIQHRNTRKIRKNNTSGFRGSSYDKAKNKWKAQIKIDNKKKHIGYFKTAIEAAKAYDKYVIDNNLEHTTNFSN